jgi:hypothetical protein
MRIRFSLGLQLILLLLTACAGAPRSAIAPTSTVLASDTPVETPTPTDILTPSAIPSATALRTPPALPGVFQTKLLFPLDPPHTYVQNTCQYLQDKWSSTNSTPGTVVMVIMFHSITEGGVTSTNQTSATDFHALMKALVNNGFQAITIPQLTGFLEQNAKIPPRSVLLVADDRHGRQYFDQYFRPSWTQYGWTVVNAWISKDDYDGQLVLPGNIALEKEGWVDHEAHGVVHNIPMDSHASDTYITSELQGSIDAIRKNFGKTPTAIIWPGGYFSLRSVQIARQLGYQLGFTATPRGPLMFNWVPLPDVPDPQHPAWSPPGSTPEGTVKDPLMVLPRYWDTDAIRHLSAVMQIGQDATAYAQANKATELEYYDIVCAPLDGTIP